MNLINRIKTAFSIYWSFFKIGGLTFGGGLTMLPMLERELIQNKKYITEEELLDCYAIGQCTPGIIAVNTATFVGYKKAGILGGILGTLGMVSPSIIIILFVASFLNFFIDNIWFFRIMIGVRGVVCALLLNTVFSLGKKTLRSGITWTIFGCVFLASFFFKVSTILMVLFSAIAGIILDKFGLLGIPGLGKKSKTKSEGENQNE